MLDGRRVTPPLVAAAAVVVAAADISMVTSAHAKTLSVSFRPLLRVGPWRLLQALLQQERENEVYRVADPYFALLRKNSLFLSLLIVSLGPLSPSFSAVAVLWSRGICGR